MTTDFVTTSPVEDFIASVAVSSRGSELSMVNGMRSGLPATAKVGTSKLVNSTSGSRVSAPSGTAKTGTSRMRSRVAACAGGFAGVPIAIAEQHDGAAAADASPPPGCSAALRSVPSSAGSLLEENGSTTTSMRCASSRHAARSIERLREVRARLRLRRRVAARSTTSRVSIVREASASTTSVGLVSGSKDFPPLRLVQRDGDADRDEHAQRLQPARSTCGSRCAATPSTRGRDDQHERNPTAASRAGVKRATGWRRLC